MLRSVLPRVCGRRAAAASLSTYSPTLVEARPGEMGTGGRSSEANLKVAVFGASGFMGNYLAAELGALNALFASVFGWSKKDLYTRQLEVFFAHSFRYRLDCAICSFSC